jgi:hypothetical protein
VHSAQRGDVSRETSLHSLVRAGAEQATPSAPIRSRPVVPAMHSMYVATSNLSPRPTNEPDVKRPTPVWLALRCQDPGLGRSAGPPSRRRFRLTPHAQPLLHISISSITCGSRLTSQPRQGRSSCRTAHRDARDWDCWRMFHVKHETTLHTADTIRRQGESDTRTSTTAGECGRANLDRSAQRRAPNTEHRTPNTQRPR